GETKSANVCVREGMVLECQEDEIIRILSATYWYSANQTKSIVKQCEKHPNDTCFREDPDSFITECAGKQVCETHIDNKVLFDCDKKANYVEVKYTCDQKTHLIDLCSKVTRTILGEGIIESPNNPYSIPPAAEECFCVININSVLEGDGRLLFSLVGTHLMGDQERCLQYLKVGDKKRHKELCGTMDSDIPFQQFFSTKEQIIQVSFRNNYPKNHGSFRLLFQAESSDGNALDTPIHVSCNADMDTTILPIDYVPTTTPSHATTTATPVAPTVAPVTTNAGQTGVSSQSTTKPNSPSVARNDVPSGLYKPGQVAGIVIGVLLVVGLIAGAVYYFKRRPGGNVYIHKFP
ncbi:unnamed protein product, partial [Owenia fusiformis]